MKKILFRKLLIDYLTFAFFALISTSLVIWVFQAVNYLDIMIEDGRDYVVYLKFSLLNFPKIVSKILPFILFFSIFYVTIKYELNNELIIFWNFGVHKMQIINFIFLVSIFLMFLQIFLASFIVPVTQDSARSFLRSSSVNFYENFIKPQKFNDTIRGVTIYSEGKNTDGKLQNLYIKRELENNEYQITYAKSGEFKEISNTPVLVLYNGATITTKNKDHSNISFSKSDFVLSNIETNTTTYIKTQEISSNKLIKCILIFYKSNKFATDVENCSSKNFYNILKEFYKRFIIPIYIIILSLIPFFLILLSKESQNYNRIRLLTFLVGFAVIIFSETTIKFISSSIIQNIILSIIPIFLFFFIYIFFYYKFKMKFKSSN
tara:strand:- start:218 stop:1348 length:1131 start_codon:yes stop_codon:yes gene_type:complete